MNRLSIDWFSLVIATILAAILGLAAYSLGWSHEWAKWAAAIAMAFVVYALANSVSPFVVNSGPDSPA